MSVSAPPGVDVDLFARAASHDLADPLRMISAFGRLLSRRYRGRLDEDADKYLEAIVTASERMQEMVDGLLAYSKAGREAAPPALVNCEELVRDVADGLQEAITESGAVLRTGELPVVLAEPAALAELFQNLLSNAIKFRGERPLEIGVEAERRDGEWWFSVADNGIGIDGADAMRVFEMFQRACGRERPGSGIGLAICRRIVERHGGRIWAETRADGGTVFRFTLPDPARP